MLGSLSRLGSKSFCRIITYTRSKQLLFAGHQFSRVFLMMKADTATAGSNIFQRLPTFAKPSHYDIHINPCLETFVFEGEEKIDVQVSEPTTFFKLYSHQLEILNASYQSSGQSHDLAVTYDEKWQTATLMAPGQLTPGAGRLDIRFKGILNDELKGFYRSKYIDQSGQEKYMATTQFESISARAAFPCWDEPLYKATFDIQLTVPKDKTALSNAREVSETEVEDGLKTVKFARTPLMSTYLVAFVVSDLGYLEGFTKDNIRVRVYTLPGKTEQGRFALELALAALPFYTDFFSIPYSLDKCDLIAIPDFNMGAMENWGLVTYREVYILLDPKMSSQTGKENIALVVGHELAHMWFGNLATMKWWTDLWLKEGYATFMEYLFVHSTFPDWDMWTKFIMHETLGSMGLDALKSSHPIEVPINDPDEVEEIYDSISYAKSSTIIRMLYSYLGNKTFQNGLRTYLNKFQFSNAETQDLWASLSSSSGQDIATIMSNWTLKMGYPVIKVSSKQDGNNRVLHLEQHRFLADGSKDEQGTIWQVPLTISTSKNPSGVTKRALLKDREADIVIEGIGPDDWVKLNAQFCGYYRVQYSEDMLRLLIEAVRTKQMGPTDRFNVVGDLYALVRSGTVSATQFFDLLECMEDETDLNVWSDVDSSVSSLSNVIERTDYKDKFNSFIRKVYAKIGTSLGWDKTADESSSTSQLRPLILYRLGAADDQDVLAEAKKRFEADQNGSAPLDPNLRSKVYALFAKSQGENAFGSLTKINETSDFSEVQRHSLLAIGQNKDKEIHKKAIDYAISTKVRPQDLYLVIMGVASTALGQEAAWEFFKENLDMLAKRYGGESATMIINLLKICCGRHCSEDTAQQIEEFFAKTKRSAGLSRPLNQSLESIRLNAALLKRDEANMGKWLVDHGY